LRDDEAYQKARMKLLQDLAQTQGSEYVHGNLKSGFDILALDLGNHYRIKIGATSAFTS